MAFGTLLFRLAQCPPLGYRVQVIQSCSVPKWSGQLQKSSQVPDGIYEWIGQMRRGI